jgi:hypothetical protein
MRRTRVVLVLLAVLVLGGCGADSERTDTSGVDELVIPTPTPDPDDFVGYVDNPFLPLEEGNEWTYTSPTATTRVRVEPSNLVVAGVRVTAVRTVVQPLELGEPADTTDYYAQDRAGNVWWFGRQGVWDAGSAGEAGLAMPGEPRVGDGWRRGYQEGVVEDRLTVLELDGDTLVLRQESDLEPGVSVRLEYAKGYGLVSSLGPEGSNELSSGP